MGGNLTKDQLNVPQNISQKAKSQTLQSKILDWPTPQLRKNIQHSQIQTVEQERSPGGSSIIEQCNNSIEEDAFRNPPNRLSNYQRPGSLSRKQKNALPLMTQRVLSSTLVLCKVPLHTKNVSSFQNNLAPYENTIEVQQELSPKSQRVQRQSKQSEFSPPSKQTSHLQKTSFQANNTIKKDTKTNTAANKKSLFVKLGSSEYERKSVLGTSTKVPQRTSNIQQSTIARRNNNLKKTSHQVLDQSDMSQGLAEQINNQKLAISKIVNKHVKQSHYNSPQVKKKEVLKQSSVFEIPEDSKQLSTSRQMRTTGKLRPDNIIGGTTRASTSKMYNIRRDSSNARLDTRDTMGLEYDMKLKQSSQIQRQKTNTKYSNNQTPLQHLKSVDLPLSQQETDTIQEVNLEQLPQKQEYKEISLPAKIVMLILQYNIDEFPKLQRISASWHTVINDALDEYSNKIENSFVISNSKALNFIKSYNSATPITFCNQKGMRLDRIFQCEIVDNSSLFNHTMMIACDYEYLQVTKPKYIVPMQRYRTEYMFDVVNKGKQRVTWMHLSDELPPYSQNEIQMSPGDIIEFAVTLYNMNGLVNIDTFEWENIELFKIQKNERDPLIYNRDLKILKHKNDRKTKVHCNTNRICEVEDAVPEWITVGKEFRDQPKIKIETQKYTSRFNVLSVQFNELDIHYNKIVLQTKRRGVIEKSVFGEGIEVHVKAQDDSITNEIKKRGVMFDRNKGKEKIQLRVGDILVVYNSIRIPYELQPDIVFPESSYNSRASSAYNTNQTNKEDSSKANTNPN